MENLINDNLDSSSSDESDNKSDNESGKPLRNVRVINDESEINDCILIILKA